MNKDEKEVLESMLIMLPEFKVHWSKYSDEEKKLFKDDFDPCLYEVASEFSQCVIKQFNYGNEEFLKSAFNHIEELGEHPNEEISNCAMVGFVEGVLMLRSHKGIALNAFDSYLGNNSKEFWYGMHKFFTGGA
jgi:hypothetical protein